MPLAVTRGAVTLTLDSKYARFQSCVNTMESEPARVPGSGANGCAGNAVGFEFSALRSWEMKPLGGGPRLESGWGREALGFEFSVFRPLWRVNLSGGRRRPESGRARGSALGLKTSTLCCWPRPSWSTGPVRYTGIARFDSAVANHGEIAQLAQSARPMIGRSSVRC
jgi:hypothetical protein